MGLEILGITDLEAFYRLVADNQGISELAEDQRQEVDAVLQHLAQAATNFSTSPDAPKELARLVAGQREGLAPAGNQALRGSVLQALQNLLSQITSPGLPGSGVSLHATALVGSGREPVSEEDVRFQKIQSAFQSVGLGVDAQSLLGQVARKLEQESLSPSQQEWVLEALRYLNQEAAQSQEPALKLWHVKQALGAFGKVAGLAEKVSQGNPEVYRKAVLCLLSLFSTLEKAVVESSQGSDTEPSSMPNVLDILPAGHDFPDIQNDPIKRHQFEAINRRTHVFLGVKPKKLEGLAFDFDETSAQKQFPLGNNFLTALTHVAWLGSSKNAMIPFNIMSYVVNYVPTLMANQTAAFIAKNWEALRNKDYAKIKPILLITNAPPDKLARYFNAVPFAKLLFMGYEFLNKTVTTDDVLYSQSIASFPDLVRSNTAFLEAMAGSASKKGKIQKVGFEGLEEWERNAFSDILVNGLKASKHPDVIKNYSGKSAFENAESVTLVDNQRQHGLVIDDHALVQIPPLHPESRIGKNLIVASDRLATTERALMVSEEAIFNQIIAALSEDGDNGLHHNIEPTLFHDLVMTPFQEERGSLSRTQYPTVRALDPGRTQIREFWLQRDDVKKMVAQKKALVARLTALLKEAKGDKGEFLQRAKEYLEEHKKRIEDLTQKFDVLALDPARLVEVEDKGWSLYPNLVGNSQSFSSNSVQVKCGQSEGGPSNSDCARLRSRRQREGRWPRPGSRLLWL